MTFVKDFSIPLPVPKAAEIFKKCAVNNKPLQMEQFLKAINRMSLEENKLKIGEIDKKLKKIKKSYLELKSSQ